MAYIGPWKATAEARKSSNSLGAVHCLWASYPSGKRIAKHGTLRESSNSSYLSQFHKLCYAKPPLQSSSADDLNEFLMPRLTLLSVPRADIHINGPFEALLRPLLKSVSAEEVAADRVIVPCFTKQLPAIELSFPNATLVTSISDGADSQASIRSVVLRPHLGVDYILKMSLAYKITSGIRTIPHWDPLEAIHITRLLEALLPPNLWIFREVAGVTGARKDPRDARQISCIIREDLTSRAVANNESLIIAAALYHRPAGDSRTYAESLFSLDSWDSKLTWFRG